MNANQAIERLRQALRRQHKALSTEDAYVFWLRRYLKTLSTMDPGLSSDKKVESFLTQWPRIQVLATRVAPYAGINAIPLRLDFGSQQPWTDNGLELKLDGPLTTPYRVQTSSNLVDWLTTTNFSYILVSSVHFRDDSATHGGRRFYRAVTP